MKKKEIHEQVGQAQLFGEEEVGIAKSPDNPPPTHEEGSRSIPEPVTNGEWHDTATKQPAEGPNKRRTCSSVPANMGNTWLRPPAAAAKLGVSVKWLLSVGIKKYGVPHRHLGREYRFIVEELNDYGRRPVSTKQRNVRSPRQP